MCGVAGQPRSAVLEAAVQQDDMSPESLSHRVSPASFRSTALRSIVS